MKMILLGSILGTLCIIFVVFIITVALTKSWKRQFKKCNLIFLGKLEDNHEDVNEAMKYLKLTNSIKD